MYIQSSRLRGRLLHYVEFFLFYVSQVALQVTSSNALVLVACMVACVCFIVYCTCYIVYPLFYPHGVRSCKRLVACHRVPCTFTGHLRGRLCSQGFTGKAILGESDTASSSDRASAWSLALFLMKVRVVA